MNTLNSLFKLALVVAAALAIQFTQSAQAHAFLDHADPKVGSTLPASPGQVKVWFTEEIEPAFSKMHVMDASGKVVSTAEAHVDPTDATILILPLPKLPAGVYTVMWQVVAKDTHHTHGTFTFEVKP